MGIDEAERSHNPKDPAMMQIKQLLNSGCKHGMPAIRLVDKKPNAPSLSQRCFRKQEYRIRTLFKHEKALLNVLEGLFVFTREEQDSNLRYPHGYNCLAGSPNRPLWHLPIHDGPYSGEGEIRTHGTLARTTVFKTVAINRSTTSP